MSLTAMVKRQAIQKRTATQPIRKVTLTTPDGRTTEADIVEEQPSDNDKDPARSAIAVLAHYIPTEVIAVYIAAIAAVTQINVGSKPSWLEESVYIGCIALVFVFVFAAHAAERKTMNEEERETLSLPYWPCFAGAVAFAVWALAIPQPEPIFAQLKGYEPLIGVGAILSAFLLQALEKALPDL